MANKKKKIVFIDYLKVLGLLLIILAHTCENPIIMYLRVFDVPLMVIISGFLAYDSYQRAIAKGGSIWDYYKKRIVRLVFPTWIFLTFYLIILNFGLAGGEYPYTVEKIIRSYLLLDGIGYVWIIRVYLLCALITPLVVEMTKRIKKEYYIYGALLLLYVAYEVAVYFGVNKINPVFEFILAYAISYGIIYTLGMLSKTSKTKYYDFMISGLSLVVFIITFIINYLNAGEIVSVQTAKYPPVIYYVSYSMFVGFLLMGIGKRVKLKENRIIQFISRSSLWIYLWHILLIWIVGLWQIPFWPLNYLLVTAGACLITYLQNKLIDYLSKNKKIDEKYLVVFRG